jgi:hypothetical protein
MFLDPSTDHLKVILFDGVIHERDPAEPEKYQISTFERYTFFRTNLGFDIDDSPTDFRGDREMTSTQILALISERRGDIARINNDLEALRLRLNEAELADDQRLLEMEEDYQILHEQEDQIESTIPRRTPSEALLEEQRRFTIRTNLLESQKAEQYRQIRSFTVEMHKKYSLALACLIMLMVGLPIGMMTKTSGVGVAFTFSALIFAVYYAFIVLGEEIGKRGNMNPVLSMWLPCIVFSALAIFLIYIAKKEKYFDVMILWNWVVKRFKVIASKFKRKKYLPRRDALHASNNNPTVIFTNPLLYGGSIKTISKPLSRQRTPLRNNPVSSFIIRRNVSTFFNSILHLSLHFNCSMFAISTDKAFLLPSTNVTFSAPRDKASNPKEPHPAYKSRTFAMSTSKSYSVENIISRI